VPFREALACRIRDQVGVIEPGHAQTQRTINQQLPKRGEEQIRAAHDLTDLHGRVIRYYRQLISRHVVFPPNKKIAKILARDPALCSKALIGELQRFPLRDAKTPVVTRRRLKVADRRTLRPAGSWINRLLVFMVRRAGRLKDIAPRAGAGVEQRRIPQFLPGGQIVSAPFTLGVRRKRSANVRSFIPAQSKPMKVFDDGVAKLRPASIPIQVLDPENELSASLSSAFLRKPKRYRMPDVKISRGRWGDTAAVGNFRFQIADFRLPSALQTRKARFNLKSAI
jgi:hypothetical protein